MRENLNITVKTTGAEAPWSNGLVECHNQTISEMLNKVLEDTDCDFDIALAWCVNAKNSLDNCHGFSPYQLAIGRNPKLPALLHDKLPALTSEPPSSEILQQNLNALHTAREAFIQSEHSEKLRHALSSNTCTYSDIVILNGDIVYYKRNGSSKWKGPATVLGKEGQQVLLKHGGFYIRVHPCRLRKAREQSTPNNQGVNTEQTSSNPLDNPVSSTTTSVPESPITPSDSDTDSDNETRPTDHHHTSAIAPTPPPTPRTTAVNRRNLPRRAIQKPFLQEPRNINTNSQTDHLAIQTESYAIPDLNTLRKNNHIKYRLKDNDTWNIAELHSRAGKATGKWKHSWNVVSINGNIKPLDFDNDVSDWCHMNPKDTESEIVHSETLIA